MPTIDSTPSLPGRKRIRSAPAKVASTTPLPPQTSFHSKPKPTPGLSQRKQVTRLSRTDRKQDDKARKRKEIPTEIGRKGAEVDRRKERTSTTSQINNNASSSSSRSAQKPKAKSTTSKAHQILVDQVVMICFLIFIASRPTATGQKTCFIVRLLYKILCSGLS